MTPTRLLLIITLYVPTICIYSHQIISVTPDGTLAIFIRFEQLIILCQLPNDILQAKIEDSTIIIVVIDIIIIIIIIIGYKIYFFLSPISLHFLPVRHDAAKELECMKRKFLALSQNCFFIHDEDVYEHLVIILKA